MYIGELGRTSLTIGRVINVIKYWLKVVQLDDINYVKIVYNIMCRDLAIKPNNTSINQLRYLLQSIGFNNVWMKQGVGNVNLFICIFKERLNNKVIQNWNSDLIECSRARTYVLFHNVRLQPYVTCITLEQFRISLSRLKMSSYRLKVETGR